MTGTWCRQKGKIFGCGDDLKRIILDCRAWLRSAVLSAFEFHSWKFFSLFFLKYATPQTLTDQLKSRFRRRLWRKFACTNLQHFQSLFNCIFISRSRKLAAWSTFSERWLFYLPAAPMTKFSCSLRNKFSCHSRPDWYSVQGGTKRKHQFTSGMSEMERQWIEGKLRNYVLKVNYINSFLRKTIFINWMGKRQRAARERNRNLLFLCVSEDLSSDCHTCNHKFINDDGIGGVHMMPRCLLRFLWCRRDAVEMNKII